MKLKILIFSIHLEGKRKKISIIARLLRNIFIISNFLISSRRYELKSPDYYTKHYSMKLKKRCELQLQNGATNCEKSFEKVHKKCLDSLPPYANQILCSPLKIDFICGVVNVFGDAICDPSNVIDASFGDEYAQLKEKGMNFMSDYRNISFNYTKVNPNELHAIQMANETTREISQILNEKTRLMDYVFNICSKLMIVIYVKIIFGEMQNYQQNYFFFVGI